jgi:hypothetical protein
MDFTVVTILIGEEAITPMILSGDLLLIMAFMDLVIILIVMDMGMGRDIIITDFSLDFLSTQVFMVAEHGIIHTIIMRPDIIILDKMSLITQEEEVLPATVTTVPQQLEMLQT